MARAANRSVKEWLSDAEHARARGDAAAALQAVRAAGQVLIDDGRPDEALALFERLNDPGGAAEVYAARGDWRAAAELWFRAKDYAASARARVQLQEMVVAAELFERGGCLIEAAELHETRGDRARAAALYEKSGEPIRAARIFLGAADAAPREAKDERRALAKRAAFLLVQGGALDEAVTALAERGESAVAGLLLARAGRTQEGIQHLIAGGELGMAAEVAHKAGNEPLMHRILGEKSEREGLVGAAAAHYERAGELAKAARFYELAGDPERAAMCAARAARTSIAPAKVVRGEPVSGELEPPPGIAGAGGAVSAGGAGSAGAPLGVPEGASLGGSAGASLGGSARASLGAPAGASLGGSAGASLAAAPEVTPVALPAVTPPSPAIVASTDFPPAFTEDAPPQPPPLPLTAKRPSVAPRPLPGSAPAPASAGRRPSLAPRAPLGPPPAPTRTVLRGRFEVGAPAGTRGDIEINLARDISFGHVVAVERLSREAAANPRRVAKFLAEARIAARVRHRNCLAIYDFGLAEGVYFVAREHFAGEPLDRFLARVPALEPIEALGLARNIAGGLEAVHAAGLIHGALEPANVLVDPVKDVRLAGFSVTEVADSEIVAGRRRDIQAFARLLGTLSAAAAARVRPLITRCLEDTSFTSVPQIIAELDATIGQLEDEAAPTNPGFVLDPDRTEEVPLEELLALVEEKGKRGPAG